MVQLGRRGWIAIAVAGVLAVSLSAVGTAEARPVPEPAETDVTTPFSP
jgi:hypothetical protein